MNHNDILECTTLPGGWVVHLNKYLDPSSRSDDVVRKFKDKQFNIGAGNLLAFGAFDRMSFTPVSYFQQYREETTQSYRWVGKRMSVLTYRLPTVTAGIVRWDTGNIIFTTPDGSNEIQPRFVILSMLRMSGAAKVSMNDYSGYLKEVAGRIYKITAHYRDKLNDSQRCLFNEVLGSFNPSELAIVWCADQYTDVLYLLDQLRQLQITEHDKAVSVFVSSYSVISVNRNTPKEKLDFSGVRGTALIQLENAGKSSQEAYDYLQNHTQECCNRVIASCAGEYDFIVRLPAQELSKLFNFDSNDSDKPLSVHNTSYCEIFRQSTTNLSYSEDDIVFPNGYRPEQDEVWKECFTLNLFEGKATAKYPTDRLNVTERIDIDAQLTPKPLEQTVDTVDIQTKIRDAVNGNPTTTDMVQNLLRLVVTEQPDSGLRETIYLLYSDYVNIISCELDHLWVKDYDQQFRSAIVIIASLLASAKQAARSDVTHDTNQKIQEICSVLHQQVNHIADSGKLFVGTPNSTMGYTAQFDQILHFYYGLVKELIYTAYNRPQYSWQYSLVPVINFDNSFKITSTMYRTGDEDPDAARLIAFQIPYSAWSDPVLYCPYIVHEVYHYISPDNRDQRNANILTVILGPLVIALADAIAESYKLDKYVHRLFSNTIYEKSYTEIHQFALDAIRDMKHENPVIPGYQLKGLISTWFEKNCDQVLNRLFKIFCNVLVSEDIMPRFTCFTDCRQLLSDICENSDQLIAFIEERIKHYNCDYPAVLQDRLYSAAEYYIYQMREIMPDRAMIQIIHMKLVDYLYFFILNHIKADMRPKELRDDNIELRIGPVFDSFFTMEDAQHHELPATDDVCREISGCRDILRQRLSSQLKFEYHREVDIYRIVEDWLQELIRHYRYYAETYGPYRQSLVDIALGVTVSLADSDSPLAHMKDIYEDYWELEPKLKFQRNIKLINSFHLQHDIGELTSKDHEKAVTADPHSSVIRYGTYQTEYQTEYTADNVNAVIECVRNAQEMLAEFCKKSLGNAAEVPLVWYRGVNQADRHVVPSLFVNYGKEAYRDLVVSDGKFLPPYKLLMQVYEQFKYRADGAPEIVNYAAYNESDYLALMQHYQQPTNMLDWSDDLFASLFFALQAYVEHDKDKIRKKANIDAALYLFSPELYNLARRKIIQALGYNYPVSVSFSKYRKKVTASTDIGNILVPNVSISSELEKYDFLFKPLEQVPNFPQLNRNASLETNPEQLLNLPVALYTARLNPRIKSQSGQFVAYPPFAMPAVTAPNDALTEDSKKRFDYIGLDEIQNYYLTAFKKDHNEVECLPFLCKITIQSHAKESIADDLRRFGIHTYNYYPELTNQQFT